MSPAGSRRSGLVTPLSVVALFLSVTETVLGVGVTHTAGTVQVALTFFVVTFPAVIAVGFFLILWNRAFVLYPPNEYGQQTDVATFVEAMKRGSNATMVAAQAVGQLTPPTPTDPSAQATQPAPEMDLANCQEQVRVLTEQGRQAINMLFSERLFRTGYGTQFAFLQFLNARGVNGANDTEAQPFFDYHLSSLPPGSATPDRGLYFGFLVNAGVIRSAAGGMYYITDSGRNFLVYAATAGLPLNTKPF